MRKIQGCDLKKQSVKNIIGDNIPEVDISGVFIEENKKKENEGEDGNQYGR
jgi:hypothetical protein